MFKIDSKFPEFSLEAYNPKTEEIENISSDKFKGRWYVLIFYPADFTFVCPTELVDVNNRYEDFKKLNAEVVGVSTDTAHTHRGWIQMEELLHGLKYPLASDHTGNFSRELGILYEDSAKRSAPPLSWILMACFGPRILFQMISAETRQRFFVN